MNYFKINGLKIHEQKTKIAIFHKGRLKEESGNFHYEENPIEMVNKFCYLSKSFPSSAFP